MKNITGLLFILLTACATPQVHKDETSNSERQAIQMVVLDYFQGQGEASAVKLRSAFAEDIATMITTVPSETNGTIFKRRNIGDVIPIWVQNSNPPGASSNYEFFSVEIVDNRLATVTFRSKDRFYDALILMKANNEWQIVSKAYVQQ